MCNKHKFPIFPPAEDSALINEWVEATNTGEQLHALMSDEFGQGFLMGRMLTMMEQQLEMDDEASAGE